MRGINAQYRTFNNILSCTVFLAPFILQTVLCVTIAIPFVIILIRPNSAQLKFINKR